MDRGKASDSVDAPVRSDPADHGARHPGGDDRACGDAIPLARALLAGGLNVVEITLRTPAALEAVRAIIAEVTDDHCGIGTVVKPLDVTHAIDAGADFLVSPGTPANLAQALADAPVPALPGCATVSEAMTLAAFGFPVLKFFPAEPSGGVRWLKAVVEPLPDIRFCPTGGVTATTRRPTSRWGTCWRSAAPGSRRRRPSPQATSPASPRAPGSPRLCGRACKEAERGFRCG